MVWFQCEDCGENLKKPKLPNHFRICSANKLSCIDCGKLFDQQSVQSHTQCVSEAEKYGPKDGKASHDAQSKPIKPKQQPDFDVNVGLSTHPPWFCSLCNTYTTSKQTLLLHADGKKHRAKARGFHAAKKQANLTEEPMAKAEITNDTPKVESVEANGSAKANDPKERIQQDTNASIADGKEKTLIKKKRKRDASEGGLVHRMDESNGEVIQAEQTKVRCPPKGEESVHSIQLGEDDVQKHCKQHKMKLKKLVISILNSNPDGGMKLKKLQKLVMKAIEESGVVKDKGQLQEKLINKINSSSRFVVDNKYVRLVQKNQ